MQKRIPIKNHVQEIQLTTHRVFIALIIMCILILILICRLGYLQLARNHMYSTLSKKNWLDLVPTEPTRGLIFDRKGVLLADNVPVFSLDVYPYKIENLPKTLAEISKIIPLTDTDFAQFHKQLKQHRRFDEIPLKMRLSESEVAKFYEDQFRFPGVIVKARLMRYYPLGNSFSHILGYVARINTSELKEIDQSNYSATNYFGKLGIEKYYEDELHGNVGYAEVENDASGETIRILKQNDPKPGKNLYLTIDSRLQIAAQQALNGHRGAIVAIQPKTGQVLAMVSEPSFDPNLFVAGISTDNYKMLQSSNDRPLYDRALRGLYPLASTIKPFIALEGLDAGVTTADTKVYDPGWFKLKNTNHYFHDWNHQGHGMVNLSRAITISCDTYFFDLAAKLGITRIDNILTQFGFGEPTGIDLDGELAGIIASPDWKKRVKGVPWYQGDTINSGIGQGFMQATPLQLAVAAATLANRGTRYTPYLLMVEQGQHSATPATPAAEINLKDEQSWKIVINAMQSVISSPEGTAHKLFGKPSYTVAAKTGTAQVYSLKHSADEYYEKSDAAVPEKLRDHTLLIAFAPVENPEIAVAIVVENTKTVLPIARQFLDFYFKNNTVPNHAVH